MQPAGEGWTAEPWIGRWRGQVVVVDDWMNRSGAPRKEAINLDTGRALRLDHDRFGNEVEPVDDPAEYREAQRRYDEWMLKRELRAEEMAAEEAAMAARAEALKFRPILTAPAPADDVPHLAASPPSSAPVVPARSRAALLKAERERYAAAADFTGAVLYPYASSDGAPRSLLQLPDAEGDACFDLQARDVVLADPVVLMMDEPLSAGPEWESAIRALVEWQRGVRVAQERAELLASLAEWTSRLHTFPYPVHAEAAWLSPSAEDIELALRWCKSSDAEDLWRRHADAGGTERFRHRLAEHYPGGRPASVPSSFHELTRNLSARIAERVVRRCCEAAGARVHDVAVEQIAARGYPPAVTEYDRCDLRVEWNGAAEYLDVKNVRHDRSALSVELCVPKFKRTRGTDAQVLIAGVVSPYVNLGQLLKAEYWGEITPCVVGLFSEAALQRIKRRIGSDSRVEIDVSPGDGRRPGLYLSPWTFEFPAAAYRGRREVALAARRTMAAHPDVWMDPDQSPWPLFIAAGGVRTLPDRVAALPAPWDAWVRTCAGLPRTPSLPLLYVALVEHFFSSLLQGMEAGMSASELRAWLRPRYHEFLFADGYDQAPLGVADPTGSIRSLVKTLESLLKAPLPRLLRFDRFRFRRTGEVAGRVRGATPKDRSRWRTILFPYCGSDTCQRRRLRLGKDGCRNCIQCGKLICPNPACSFCSPPPDPEMARRYGWKDCAPRRRRRVAWRTRLGSVAPRTSARRPAPRVRDDDDDLPF